METKKENKALNTLNVIIFSAIMFLGLYFLVELIYELIKHNN